MFAFSHVWPWIGLGAAGVLFVLLSTNALRSDRSVSRWRDLVWLTWAAVFAYLVHQFEEHGIDVQNRVYAFRGFLCAEIGFADTNTCPVPLAFITAVNVAAVWVAGPLSALLAARWPVIGLSFFAIPSANLFAHIFPTLTLQSYNPGLFTALALFPPLSLLAFAAAITRYHLGVRAVLATLFAGAVLHAILMGSLLSFVNGRLDLDTLVLLQIANPLLSALLVVILSGRRVVRRFAT
ncbi:MAG: HXXEE domain-containing protein [Reyranella sp.]|uniref:HXXEE domain-containing protein n=1 Tax=Reyranella sp. TaxID=1929291 RepID=UPI001AC127D8|nr:HXXEE domain-containing protein [Reyranella sp.]MBN9090045.1 HXXEE domain-containing protein [Reyranella sp.]